MPRDVLIDIEFQRRFEVTRSFKIFGMWQLCAVLLCFLTADVSATRQLRSAGDSVSPSVDSVVISNKTADNNTSPTNNSISTPERKAGIASVVEKNVNESKEAKTEEKSKLPTVPKEDDQRSPLNSIFSKTPTGAALRGLYVFVGLSAVVMLYIAVKLIRLRRKKMRIRKYGLIANADDVEMTPLGAEDDDEDTTLFDAHNHIGR